MENLKILVIFIILFKNYEARKICYEVPDTTTESPPLAAQDDEVDLGDMILSKKQYDALFSTQSFKRHGLARSFAHWPNGEVNFKIDLKANFTDEFLDIIKDSMNYIMSISCIRFKYADKNATNFIFIQKKKRCSSQVGKKGKKQNMFLYDGCTKGNIIHELLHALGFLHMHTAVDRDNYVTINWDNINRKKKFNFQKYTAYVSMFGTKYDYDSIMHYHPYAFAKNRKEPTIIQKKKHSESKMGQREKMSDGDIKRLNKMYKCHKMLNILPKEFGMSKSKILPAELEKNSSNSLPAELEMSQSKSLPGELKMSTSNRRSLQPVKSNPKSEQSLENFEAMNDEYDVELPKLNDETEESAALSDETEVSAALSDEIKTEEELNDET